MPTPPEIQGLVVEDTTIPAREHWSGTMKPGQMMRIIDLVGEQGVDFLVFNATDHLDRYAAADTMKINGKIFIENGSVLYSINCNPLMTMINRTRYNAPGQRNCR